MFLQSIKIRETTPCLADPDLFKCTTVTSRDISEIFPYLNAVLERPNYQPEANTFIFKKGITGFTLNELEINVTKFANMTEAYELLDWVKDLINDTYERRDEITPNHKGKKTAGVLRIYGMLPKTNCKKCSVASCMAFASKLSKLKAEIDECPPLHEEEFREQRKKLLKMLQ